MSSNFIYFCITVKKKTMAVIEVQLGLPPETSKKKGSNLTAEEEILLIEDILICEGTLFGKMYRD